MTAHDATDPTDPGGGGEPTVVDGRPPGAHQEELKREIKRCPECGQHYGSEARFCPFDGTSLEATSFDPAQDSLLGVVVDERYEVCSVLGEGGMGTVYKVRHTSLERFFAMKVLRKDLARDADLAARFTQEARATASIKHPNVVQITDFGRIPGDPEVPYFVMELLVGQPLSAIIKSRGVLPTGTACSIVLKIAGALGAAHEAGIVHRDLKPENVFIVGRSASALGDDVRVVDFGAAKVMGASRVTKTGIVFGTPHFMSPEQASGATVDHRADIYALGVIMYELFTGRVPFEADTYMGVLTQHMFVQPEPPSRISQHPDALGALEEVILKALEKKPEDRYGSMDLLADAVRAAVRFGADGSAVIAPAKKPSGAPRASEERVSASRASGPPPRDSLAYGELPKEGPPGWLLAVAAAALATVLASAAWVALRSRTPPAPPAALAAPRPVAPAAASPAAPAPIAAPPPPPSSSFAPPPAPPAAADSARRPPSPPRPPRAAPKDTKPVDTDFMDPWKKSRP